MKQSFFHSILRKHWICNILHRFEKWTSHDEGRACKSEMSSTGSTVVQEQRRRRGNERRRDREREKDHFRASR